MLLFHVFFAVVSLGYSTISIFRPGWGNKSIIYLLGILTAVSGGILAVNSDSSFGKLCLAGFVYFGYTGLSLFRLGEVKL